MRWLLLLAVALGALVADPVLARPTTAPPPGATYGGHGAGEYPWRQEAVVLADVSKVHLKVAKHDRSGTYKGQTLRQTLSVRGAFNGDRPALRVHGTYVQRYERLAAVCASARWVRMRATPVPVQPGSQEVPR